MISSLLQLASVASTKAVTLNNAQKKAIEEAEKQISNLDVTMQAATDLAARKVETKEWTKLQAKLELAICSAQIEAQKDELQLKIKEINPAWNNGLTDVTKVAAIRTLEALGHAAGVMGQAIATAKKTAKTHDGAWQAPAKQNLADLVN